MKWDSVLYDKKHDFVSEYGKGLLEYIPKDKEKSILDLGCGTGTLTAQLKKRGGRVLGVDSSPSMIRQAVNQYQKVDFLVCDALALPFQTEWDIVFSNAVFHWIPDHDRLLKNIYKALKPGGRMICEFGAAGNLETVEKSFSAALNLFGHSYRPKWNFPTVEQFGELLIANGFVIDEIYDYERPTPLKDGSQGLSNWIQQFYASELAAVPKGLRLTVLDKAEEYAKEKIWNGAEWIADYRRLRVIAHI